MRSRFRRDLSAWADILAWHLCLASALIHMRVTCRQHEEAASTGCELNYSQEESQKQRIHCASSLRLQRSTMHALSRINNHMLRLTESYLQTTKSAIS